MRSEGDGGLTRIEFDGVWVVAGACTRHQRHWYPGKLDCGHHRLRVAACSLLVESACGSVVQPSTMGGSVSPAVRCGPDAQHDPPA
jgi:hypothetical protein